MARIDFMQNKNEIPADVEKTLGELEVIQVLEPREELTRNADGEFESTGTVKETPVELLSSVLEGAVEVSFEPTVAVKDLKKGDQIELMNCRFVVYSNSQTNNRATVKIWSSGFKKVPAGLETQKNAPSVPKEKPAGN